MSKAEHKTSKKDKDRAAKRPETTKAGGADQPQAGPHARPELTDPDKTPGAGALPDPATRDILPGTS